MGRRARLRSQEREQGRLRHLAEASQRGCCEGDPCVWEDHSRRRNHGAEGPFRHQEVTEDRGQRTKELNDEEFNAAIIEAATVSPNWGDKKLLSTFRLSSGREVIKRKLLAGEMMALADKVMELSGFDDELEEIENIKN